MKKVKGYIFSRSFFGERVPQHVQNVILKDFCNNKSLSLLMSATEYSATGSSYILLELIKNIRNYDGIIMYSLFQLPNKKKIRENIYKKILEKEKIIYFAVENLSLKNKNDKERIEEIFLIKQAYEDKSSIFKIGKLKNYITPKHLKTKRSYLHRMNDNKVKCMKISKKYQFDYWDGNRKYGYGGYKYIKDYHKTLALNLIKNYSLNKNSKILDIGCGKGFLIYEIKKIIKEIKIYGCDISNYAIKNAKKEIKSNIFKHDASKKFNFPNKNFDLVISINTLHNLKLTNLEKSLKEIERLGKKKFICVESYRNEKEQFNLYCWALTAETLLDVNAWKWLFKNNYYSGDFEFIFFS